MAPERNATAKGIGRKRSKPGRALPRKASKADVELDQELPGLQKLKSALRSTRRLLAREDLGADVRVETERRLKSLESDLETVERAKRERNMAVRYHKIKFFEKTKVLRRIKQTKKELNQQKQDSPNTSRSDLESRLFESRARLNYILHYPKVEKYIALFSASAEHGELSDSARQSEGRTDVRRAELLDGIKEKMRAGILSGAPELEGNEGSQRSISLKGPPAGRKPEGSQEATLTNTNANGAKDRKEEPGKKTSNGGVRPKYIDDDFFDAATSSECDSDARHDT